VPAGRGETENEDMYLSPRHLQEDEMMDSALRALIVVDRIRFQHRTEHPASSDEGK
jgi:hypothetical protein